MELQFISPESVCLASSNASSRSTWNRLKQAHASWLMVQRADGEGLGLLRAETVRDELSHGVQRVGALPARRVLSLPRLAKLAEVLAALAGADVEGVALMDEGHVHALMLRAA